VGCGGQVYGSGVLMITETEIEAACDNLKYYLLALLESNTEDDYDLVQRELINIGRMTDQMLYED
jgi:hypothetical protein